MTSLPLAPMDVIGPAIGGALFVLGMSLVPDKRRVTWNAIFVAGTAGVYISGGGFGVWELTYPILVMPILYRALTSYRFIGLAWLMHSAWDLPHHLWGGPIWPFMLTSSIGCFVFDAVIGIWFVMGAPTVMTNARWARSGVDAANTEAWQRRG
jgi:hypothetical protein